MKNTHTHTQKELWKPITLPLCLCLCNHLYHACAYENRLNYASTTYTKPVEEWVELYVHARSSHESNKHAQEHVHIPMLLITVVQRVDTSWRLFSRLQIHMNLFSHKTYQQHVFFFGILFGYQNSRPICDVS